MKRALLIGGLLILVVAVAAGGYWYVEERQRISQSSMQEQVARGEDAREVTCVEVADGGRRWICAGTLGGEAQCFVGTINWRGDVNTRTVGAGKCTSRPELSPLFPAA